MKFNTILLVSVATLCLVSCSDKKNLPVVADIAGNYSGYTLANCDYFSNTCTADETISVTGNNDGTAKVAFESDSWGIFTIPNAQMSENGGVYALTGNGQTQMGMGGNTSSYDCTFTAVINSKESAEMKFQVANVMGGLSIDFFTGEAPAHFMVAGTYKGYTDADCAYFQDHYTDDESLKISANKDGTLAIEFESLSWGVFNIASAKVSKDADSYTVAGEGSVAMGMGGSVNDYDCAVTGNINAAKDNYSISFNVPAVMGGLVVTLLPGTAPTTK
ncbi:MAG: calycin-like domain-containing protein [Candidatus Limimorpha sp.]